MVAVDTREKYGRRFAGRPVTVERRALPAGDYAAVVGGEVIGLVERKTLENLATSLSDGTLAFQLQRLAEEWAYRFFGAAVADASRTADAITVGDPAL
jgi:ERCC4-type nuclease